MAKRRSREAVAVASPAAASDPASRALAEAATGVADQIEELAKEQIAKQVADCVVYSLDDLRRTLADRKETCRRTLVSLLDHLDQLPEQERLATLGCLHGEFQRTLNRYWTFARDKFPQGLVRSPRAEAYAAGQAEGVFRNSLFGGG